MKIANQYKTFGVSWIRSACTRALYRQLKLGITYVYVCHVSGHGLDAKTWRETLSCSFTQSASWIEIIGTYIRHVYVRVRAYAITKMT